VNGIAKCHKLNIQTQLVGFLRNSTAWPAQYIGGVTFGFQTHRLLKQLQFLTTDIFGTFREENAGHLNWKTKLVEITVYIRSVFAQRMCGLTWQFNAPPHTHGREFTLINTGLKYFAENFGD
tara:strand:- start:124 stop:489 length:366 start_codon:yes stop_codon:yes gene_type:complete